MPYVVVTFRGERMAVPTKADLTRIVGMDPLPLATALRGLAGEGTPAALLHAHLWARQAAEKWAQLRPCLNALDEAVRRASDTAGHAIAPGAYLDAMADAIRDFAGMVERVEKEG